MTNRPFSGVVPGVALKMKGRCCMRRLKAILVLMALLIILYAPVAQAFPAAFPAWGPGDSALTWVLRVLVRWPRIGVAPSPGEGLRADKVGPEMDPHG